VSKPKVPREQSPLELAFIEQMQSAHILDTAWVREHLFATSLVSERWPRGRRWRFDFAFVAQKVAVEVDGGTHSQGRHNRHSGFEKDCQKLNAAAELGWTVLRGTGPMVKSHELIDTLVRVLRAKLGLVETPPASAPDKGKPRPELEAAEVADGG
jgi:very-short-patch-repair endonuclease